MDASIDDLIDELIEEGYSPREAAKIAAATLRAQERRNGGTLAQHSGTHGTSGTDGVPDVDRRPVNYGEETPAEARRRWEEQERMDPQGIYSGGSESGGIFGSGPIATETYDPAAVGRSMYVAGQVQTAQVQQETLRLLQEIRQEQQDRRLPPQPQRRRFLPSFGERRLGKKKR